MNETGQRRSAGTDPSSAMAVSGTVAVPGFDVIAELGHGANTVVYRARPSDASGADVALKIVQEPAEDAIAVFRREAALLARITHPSLAAVHAVGEVAGRPYLVLELVEGVALARLIEDGPLHEDQLLDVAIDAASALDAVHGARLVHRDVKPHNLLVTPEGRAKLIDFDLATWAGELAPSDTVVGTLTYTAPEQAGMLARPVDARADLYALGVVLFECATGRPPFASPDAGELLRLHAAERPPDVLDVQPQYSPGLAAMISKLLAKDPDDRYQTATGLLVDLRALRGHTKEWPFELDAGGVEQDIARPPLVGRAAELAQLTARWEKTATEGGLALVEGGIGTGKSRLIDELVTVVMRDGGRALYATCSPDEPRAFGAISGALERHVQAVRRLPAQQRGALEQLLREAAGAGAPLLTGVSSALASLLDSVGVVLPDADRQPQVIEAIASFVTGLARLHGRMLLVVDDAQHLDDASQRVLSAVCEHDAPLLVVVTAPRGGLATLEALLPSPPDTRLTLGPLTPSAVDDLIASELGGAHVPVDVAMQLASRTGGNPFAILEFLRHLVEAGGLRPSWGTWIVDSDLLDRLHLPSDVLDLVLARIEGLSTPTRRQLAAAAIQGMRFDTSLVAVTAGSGEISDVIAAALRHRIVEHVADDTYAFVHTELRATLAATLDDATQARMHHQLAEALEARAATDVGDVFVRARHWIAAGTAVEPQRTYDACLAAGHAALAHHAPADAVGFFAGATDAAAVAGIDLDVAFRQAYATALLRAGNFPGALDQLTEALAVEQDPFRRADLFDLVATVQHSAGDGATAAETVRRGLAELGRSVPSSKPRLIVSTIARVLAGVVVAASRRWFGTSVGERRRRHTLEATLLNTGSRAAAVANDLPQSLTCMLRAVLAVNRIGCSPQRVRILDGLALFTSIVGMRRLGLRLCAAAERDATALGDPTMIAHVAWMRSTITLVTRWRTQEMADALQEHGRWLELPDYLLATVSLMQELISTGYTAAASMWAGQASRRLRAGGSPQDAFPVECAISTIEAVQGRPAAADATLRAAVQAVSHEASTPPQQLYAAWARLVSLTEQRELGDEFNDVVAQIAEAQLPSRHGHVLAMRYIVTYGRLAQAHAAALRPNAEDELRSRLAQAREGIKMLRLARSIPRLRAGRYAVRAWMLHLDGRQRAALRMLHRALRLADNADAPLLTFDIVHLHARILRAQHQEPEAQRQARVAFMLAIDYGWEHRARWIRDEFGVRDQLRTSSRSRGGGSGSVSTGQAAVHERRRLEALQEVSATAASVLDPEELIRVALDVTLRLLPAERAFVFLAETVADTTQRGDVLHPHRGCDASGNDLRDLTGYSSTLVEQVWQTGEALVVTGSEQGAALGSESAVVHGLRSILIAPLQIKGRRLGVVYLDSRVARGIFTDDDADLLGVITQHVAAALETARAAQLETAVHAAHQQRDLAETLRMSMTELNSTLDPDEVVRRLLVSVATTLPGDRAVLLRNEPDRVMAVTGEVDDGAIEVPPDAALKALLARAAPSIGHGAATLPRPVSALLNEPRSWMAIPVALRDQPAGVIVAGSSDAGTYTDVEVTVAAALVEQGTVAYDNARLFSRVQELATTDQLTGVATRRHFWDLAEQQCAAAQRHGRPLAAIMLDLDHFKAINDTHGHATGDAVLREISARLRSLVRESDILGRYGGEEFALLLPETEDASALAERLRATVADAAVPTDHERLHVTVSLGVSYLQPDDDLNSLLGRADAALYRAKAAGRNRVSVT